MRHFFLAVVVSGVFLAFGVFFVLREFGKRAMSSPSENHINVVSEFLGIREPVTYLLLFENNTELRPAGGFVGSYAVVRVDRAAPELLLVSGTETLDRAADLGELPPPPEPLKIYLGVDRWYFRDGNWSPDFAASARQMLDLYRRENGLAADDIDVVVAVTPTVLAKLLELTGPVEVDGVVFAAETVTETLEYEVEYGYAARGIPFEDRKRILGPLMREMISRLGERAFFRLSAYRDTIQTLTRERQMMAFAVSEDVQRAVDVVGASGRLVQPAGDYLLWVDANLDALKTDHAIERHLTYEAWERYDAMIATATMRYDHRGTFDWRTTRYRTYARVFVPESAEFLSVVIDGKNVPASEVAEGVELGKRWFGTFVSIEPGTATSVSFSYRRGAGQEPNTLFVQKQLGTIAHQLTVDLNFGTDKKLHEETDLREDRWFSYK